MNDDYSMWCIGTPQKTALHTDISCPHCNSEMFWSWDEYATEQLEGTIECLRCKYGTGCKVGDFGYDEKPSDTVMVNGAGDSVKTGGYRLNFRHIGKPLL